MTRFLATDPSRLAVQELDFEVLLRAAVFKSTNQLMGYLFQKLADRIDAAYQPKAGYGRKGRVPITIDCIFGSFTIQRDYYYHAGKPLGHYPTDAALGLQQGGKTPALARLVCLEGADQDSYQQAEEHLKETGGIDISARQIQRLVQQAGAAAQAWQEREALRPLPESKPAPIFYVSGDATGVPMRPEELQGRTGQQPDGTAKTRSAYLGCVFTQHQTDAQGHPVRDYESTTYVSNMGPLEEFGPLLRQEAIRRGMGQAQQVVLLIDGAPGLENMGRLNFKDAIQIVDFYHGAEHAGKVVEALLGSKVHPEYQARRSRWVRRLLGNGVENLIKETRAACTGKAQAQRVEEELDYFVHNVKRMQYRTFRRQGLFIGSGVIEAGCKTIIGSRCKQSGMFWGTPGAQNILALRCVHASRRRDQFWKERLNTQAAQNDCLSVDA
ncbi:MAG TPA: ISKra4 family transposase [Verrucomicrobiae bacterium]